MTRQYVAAQALTRANNMHLSNGTSRPTIRSSTVDSNSNTPNSNPPPASNTVIRSIAQANTTLRAKTLREQQAVLALQALAEQGQASESIQANSIADLTDKLILGAGEDVVGLAEEEERAQLEGLQRLIETRLNILQTGGNQNGGRSETGDVDGNADGEGGDTILVNGNLSPNRRTSRGNGPRGVSKSKSKSKSRERRGTSRGRK